MVSPFTLGLFAPLPLAMMIPFMATQSLAMGEAFGKSFQYGKRKISSMTNEEFNKLTFQQLMDEQTVNIKSIIPKLHEQMADSYQMQKDIFTEMTKLLPAALEALGAEFRKLGGDFDTTTSAPSPFGQNIPNPNTITQASGTTSSEITLVSHGNESTLETPLPPTSAYDKTRTMLSQWDKQYFTRAYNQRDNITNQYNEHGIPKTQFRQLLVVESKKRGVATNQTIPTETTPYYSTDPTPTQELKYHTEIQNFLMEGVALFTQLTIARTRSLKEINQTEIKTKLSKVSAWTKRIQNYITQARNIPATKSVANSDWNKRIWTTIG